MGYGNTKTPSRHSRSGSATLSQLAFPGEKQPEFPMGEIPVGHYSCKIASFGVAAQGDLNFGIPFSIRNSMVKRTVGDCHDAILGLHKTIAKFGRKCLSRACEQGVAQLETTRA